MSERMVTITESEYQRLLRGTWMIGEIFNLGSMKDRCRAAAHVLCDLDAYYMTLHKGFSAEAIPVDQPVPVIHPPLGVAA